MIPLNQRDLLSYLRQKGVDAQLEETSKQIYFSWKIEGRDFPQYIKIDPTQRVLQMILFLPCPASPEQAANVARLLHHINREIDLPGFGMDEASQTIFYRLVLPTLEGKVEPMLFDQTLNALPKVGELFFKTIATVAAGMRWETAIPQIRKLLNAKIGH